VLSKTALIAPIGMFFVMLGNGLIYAHTTKHIDNAVEDSFNLIALSVWLFVGDAGSLIAAYLVQPFQGWFGSVPTADGGGGNNSTGNDSVFMFSAAAAAASANGFARSAYPFELLRYY